jgi:polyisoprenoid-binding protein YceI
MKFLFCLFIAVNLSLPALAQNWKIDKDNSKIQFSGTHVGDKFTGNFNEIDGEINFDPNKLKVSFANINISLKSAKTSNASYDKTLPQPDWLDSRKNTFATYKTSTISHINGDTYKVEGSLTIKDITIAHSFSAKINIEGNKASLEAKTKIQRLDFDIGKSSDANGDWVALEIPITIKIQANLK